MTLLRTIFVLLGSLLLASVACAQQGTLIYDNGFGGVPGEKMPWVEYRVEIAELQKVRGWEPGKGPAPLSRAKALEIASVAAKSQGLKTENNPELTITLRRPLHDEDKLRERTGEDASLWFYVVSFGNKPDAGFVVTLGGKLAERTITSR